MEGSYLSVQTDPVDIVDVYRRLSCEDFGAQLVFMGTVRNSNNDRKVGGVTYEAYIPLAEKVFEELKSEALERYSTQLRIVLIHRIGSLKVGEISTVVGVASKHRGESYEVSRYLIEELKKRLPVWKEEHYIEGDSSWLEGSSLVP